jgi:hypothetical protein
VRKLEEQERRYRDHVRAEIDVLRNDAAVLMATPEPLNRSMREMLKQTYQDMNNAREHLDGGGSLSEIPVLVQSIELSSEPMNCEEFRSKFKSVELPKTSQLPEVELKPRSPELKESAEQELGFWEIFKKWLNTPFKVSCSDIKSRKK